MQERTGRVVAEPSPGPTPPLARDPQTYLAELAAAAERFAQLLGTADLAASVRACPGWSLAELAVHLGGTHQWARHAILAGTPDGAPTAAPSDRHGLADWYSSSAGGLLETLRRTPPQAPCWSFGPKPSTALFWFRRQALETIMHLWDAEGSQVSAAPSGSPGVVGSSGSRHGAAGIAEAAALDGVAEVVEMFFPRQVRLGRTPPLERSLELRTDGGHRWVLAGDGTATPAAGIEATVSGPAEGLLLLLWGRLDLDAAGSPLELAGDRDAARAVLAASLTP